MMRKYVNRTKESCESNWNFTNKTTRRRHEREARTNNDRSLKRTKRNELVTFTLFLQFAETELNRVCFVLK